jgi:hypothetical protein
VAGTALIQNFTEDKITCGISGWLRQEFRELNVLDEITRLHYENIIPDNIAGPLRNPMIRAYYIWMKETKDDQDWHPAIQYKSWETKIKLKESDATWDIKMFDALRKTDGKKGLLSKRCPYDINKLNPGQTTKNPRIETTHNVSVLRGLTWNPKDYSCAYDSLYTILYNIWVEDATLWSECFENLTEYLVMLSQGFKLVRNGTIPLEMVRDEIRAHLNHLDRAQFMNGTTYTCLASLTNTMMTNRQNRVSGTTYLKCMTCGYIDKTILRISECFHLRDTGLFMDGRYQTKRIHSGLSWMAFVS